MSRPRILSKVWCGWVVLVVGRAGNSSGTWEASSQKQFGLAESFVASRYYILTKLNSQVKFLPKFVLLHRTYQFLQYTHDFLCWNTLTILFLWMHTHNQKHFCAKSCTFNPIYSLFCRNFSIKTLKFPETLGWWVELKRHFRVPLCSKPWTYIKLIT